MRLASLQLFPPAWGWRRVAELTIAVYQAAVGAVLWIDPGSLAFDVYAPLRAILPAHGWSVVLWIVCLGHAVAMWTNGRSPVRSSFVRFVAAGVHMLALLVIAACFAIVGAGWPVLTMALLGFFVAGGLSVAAEDLGRARAAR